MHIVAVGASAGGLEALEAFFGAVPEDNEAAFLVVQHLPPDHKTMMVELLSRHTPLRVVLAEDGAIIDSNTIYLMPPGKHLGIDAARLRLMPRPSAPVDHPIDVLFSAVAQACGDRAGAVVLSGTGTDGTRGVAAIREAGGIVAVQEPSSARFDGMPRSALAAVDADIVDLPQALPARVLQLLQTQTQPSHTDERDRLVAEILAELRRRLSIDFSEYKKKYGHSPNQQENAGDACWFSRELSRAVARRPGRGGSAWSRDADFGDAFYARYRGIRSAASPGGERHRAVGSPPQCRAGVGARLCDRGGSLLGGDVVSRSSRMG